MNLKALEAELGTLTVFGGLHTDAVFSAFCSMLSLLEHRQESRRKASDFAGQLYRHMTDDWTAYLRDLIFTMETPCTYFASIGKPIPACIEQAARHDLSILSEAAGVTMQLVSFCISAAEYIPAWKAEPIDLETLYFERLAEIGKYGFGIFAKYRMFQMELSESEKKGYTLESVRYPDPVRLSELVGYDLQRQQVIDNTKALLAGKNAANVLLYGAAGTGKSATVKAIANEFAEDGLRLIELSKNELHLLPGLLDELGANPLKFILFIDDLSFQDNDDDFSALKAVLEGSISARSQNTVIYATSNRRHIVRETFSQRAGDEIHRNDSMQETISLSERFGIQLLFDKPNKDLYFEIVKHLAKQYGIAMNEEELALEAERFAMRKSGRSARAAKQFCNQLAAKQ